MGLDMVSKISSVVCCRYRTSRLFSSTWSVNPANAASNWVFMRLSSSDKSSISSPVLTLIGSRSSPRAISLAAS